jgi:hypothetical protein
LDAILDGSLSLFSQLSRCVGDGKAHQRVAYPLINQLMIIPPLLTRAHFLMTVMKDLTHRWDEDDAQQC